MIKKNFNELLNRQSEEKTTYYHETGKQEIRNLVMIKQLWMLKAIEDDCIWHWLTV